MAKDKAKDKASPSPKSPSEPDSGPQAPESGTGETRRGTGRSDLIAQPHGGALVPPHPPGSNGGVHRGPDRHPRVTQAQFMMALGESQVRKIKVDGKTQTVVVEMAMNKDLVAMMQLIAERAARGIGLKYGLKLLEIEEKVFRNGHANGKNGHGAGDKAPIPAQFIRSPEAPPVVEPETGAPEGEGIQANGQEYVE